MLAYIHKSAVQFGEFKKSNHYSIQFIDCFHLISFNTRLITSQL